MENELHDIQKEILKGLLFRPTARFSDLNARKLPSDQFTFHLKQLLAAKIIEKEKQGGYQLTLRGKEYANRYDVDSGKPKLEKQAKLGVMVVALRNGGKSTEVLMQRRLKQPYYGFKGFVTGKIKWGELVAQTAARELEEETGLNGQLEQKTILHEHILSATGELLEDKYFFIFIAQKLKGTLIAKFPGGVNEWVAEKEIFRSRDIFYDIADILKLIKTKNVGFLEKTYRVNRY